MDNLEWQVQHRSFRVYGKGSTPAEALEDLVAMMRRHAEQSREAIEQQEQSASQLEAMVSEVELFIDQQQ